MKKVELLAPAGNFDCLKAAINNGANAVYLGGKNFSARAFANNFDQNEIIEAVKYAHLRNVKVYVTVNTLLNENEINNAIKMIDFYYKNNIDALLIQDLGLYYYIKKNYPDFELHCSTQMHVHNIDGIKTAKKLGFKRVVIARESDLKFITEACKQDIEIETFVHGAICVSYSGQCLMSSVTKNRSANKGMCAQCCRLKYKLIENNNVLNTDTDYLLSPKDMCLINDVPDLIKAGVSSFKIEGRLKSSAYVGYITSLYRKAIDSYYKGIKYELSDSEKEKMSVLFNRDFTDDYLKDKNNLFGQKTPNHLGIEIGNAFKYKNDFTYIKLSKDLSQFDGIRINDFGCIVNKLYKDSLLINYGKEGEVVCIKTDKEYIGTVYKTLDYKLENEINDIKDIKIPLTIEAKVIANKKVCINLSTESNKYEYVSNIIAQEAINAPLTIDSIKNQLTKLSETVYNCVNITVNTINAFLPIKELNFIRREMIDEFNNYRLSQFTRTIEKENLNFNIKDDIDTQDIIVENNACISGDDNYSFNYVINKDSKYSSEQNGMICEIGGLLKDYDKKIAYYTLNCSNSYCYEFLKCIGFDKVILSTELNKNDIDNLINEYKKRTNKDCHPYILKEGCRALMYIKSNPFDKYKKNDAIYTLIDQNNKYYIRQNFGITELVEISHKNYINTINKQLFTIY